MVSAGQAHDLPQQVREDRVGGLSSEHGVLHQHEHCSHVILGVQSVQQKATQTHSEEAKLDVLKQLLSCTLALRFDTISFCLHWNSFQFPIEIPLWLN
jgi:hypothetical protein